MEVKQTTLFNVNPVAVKSQVTVPANKPPRPIARRENSINMRQNPKQAAMRDGSARSRSGSANRESSIKMSAAGQTFQKLQPKSMAIRSSSSSMPTASPSRNPYAQLAAINVSRVNAPKMSADLQQKNPIPPRQDSMSLNGMQQKAKMRLNRDKISMSMKIPKTSASDFVINKFGKFDMQKDYMDMQVSKVLKKGMAVAGAAGLSLALMGAEPAMAKQGAFDGVIDMQRGQKLFEQNCAACHMGGGNIVCPEKTLDKEDILKYLDGGFTEKAISTQMKIGKNNMPQFGSRLCDDEIADITAYVIKNVNDDSWPGKEA